MTTRRTPRRLVTAAVLGLLIALLPAAGAGAAPSDPVINEFSASTTSTDVEYVEVFGDPSTDYSGFTILELEGDSTSAPGTIDEVIPAGTTDASGFYLADLTANTLENGTITLLLVEGFTGAAGDDLDTDDDGTLDATPWTRLVDAVAVDDGGAGDLAYGTPVLAPTTTGSRRSRPVGRRGSRMGPTPTPPPTGSATTSTSPASPPSPAPRSSVRPTTPPAPPTPPSVRIR